MLGLLQRRKQLHDNRPYYYRNVLDCSCQTFDYPIKDGSKCREPSKLGTTVLDKEYAPTHAEFMRQRGLTIEQKSMTFAQLESETEFRSGGGTCDISTYKPNNAKYATQGAVSAGTRLMRLKYDAVISAGETYTPYIRHDTPIDPYCKPVYVNGRKIA
jgi:hypothetical protein